MTVDDNGDVIYTRDEYVDLLESWTVERVGFGIEELLRRYRRGELEDLGEVAELLARADLLPDDDPIRAA